MKFMEACEALKAGAWVIRRRPQRRACCDDYVILYTNKRYEDVIFGTAEGSDDLELPVLTISDVLANNWQEYTGLLQLPQGSS